MFGLKVFPPLVLWMSLEGALSAPAVVHLSCDVTALPGGLYQYQLSPGPGPDCYDQGWEDHNKTALTRGIKLNPDLVHSLANRTLVLKKCLDHTHFTAQCPGFVEANCTFNCSSVRTDLDVLKPLKNESDMVKRPNNVCLIIGGKCFDKTHFALTCSAIVVGLVLLIAGSWGFYTCKKHQQQRDLQSRAEELVQPRKDRDVPLEELKPLSDPQ